MTATHINFTVAALKALPPAPPGRERVTYHDLRLPGFQLRIGPTGEIVFHDGNTSLGSALLDGAGVAALRINTLAASAHSLTASYPGDGKFGGSTSAAVTINIANPDFSLGNSSEPAPVAKIPLPGGVAQW